MRKRYPQTYNKERLERLNRLAPLEKSFKHVQREALRDGKLTQKEVDEMLHVYNRETIERDTVLRDRLRKYGWDVKLGPDQSIVYGQVDSGSKPKVFKPPMPVNEAKAEIMAEIYGKDPDPPLFLFPEQWDSRTRKKVVWLSIVGPAVIACLMRLI